MNGPAISIIVPIYNSEKYLGRCIDSILSQSFTDFELILVDDGSKDTSPQICDEYASIDKRIRVIHKKNGGVSSARNMGLSAIFGEYFCFSDSDDTVEPNALKLMYEIINNGNFDLVIAGYNRYDESGTKIFGMNPSEVELLSKESALKEMYRPKDGDYQGYLWNKLFRSDIIHQAGLTFNEEIYFNEDRLFITQYICALSRDVAYTRTPVYNYFAMSSGAMGSLKRSYNPRYATDFDAYVLMKECVFENTKNRDLRNISLQGICVSYIENHSMMVKYDGYDPDIHSRQLQGIVRNRVLCTYLAFIFRSFLIRLLLLVYPTLLVKIKRRHPRDVA